MLFCRAVLNAPSFPPPPNSRINVWVLGSGPLRFQLIYFQNCSLQSFPTFWKLFFFLENLDRQVGESTPAFKAGDLLDSLVGAADRSTQETGVGDVVCSFMGVGGDETPERVLARSLFEREGTRFRTDGRRSDHRRSNRKVSCGWVWEKFPGCEPKGGEDFCVFADCSCLGSNARTK